LGQIFNGQIPNLQQIGVDHIVTISEETKKYIVDCFSFPEELISIVDNYIDPNLFNLNLGKETTDVVEEDENGDLSVVSKEIDVEKKNMICFMPRRGVEI